MSSLSSSGDASVFRATPLAGFFHELGACHCWEVLELLAHRSCTVTAIAKALELDMSEVSRSLAKLNQLGLVDCHQTHRNRVYTLSSCMRFERNCERAVLIIVRQDNARVTIDVPLR